ncbi:hypothetical protein [Paraburkholderia ultramafica]|uniref:hypothetical protein n=1 Tax=Paraburkholderia ultramafica TaxID=1544867 RepID=UPI001583BC7F|nr:hypothetical protein [Paraburkholderia ultramafica]
MINGKAGAARGKAKPFAGQSANVPRIYANDATPHRANVWPDEKKAGLEPAKNHTLRG